MQRNLEKHEIAWPKFTSVLRTYVRRRVTAGLVDDVVSQILLRLVRSQKELAEAVNPVAWVYRVASNIITDHYRKVAAERRLIDAVGHRANDVDQSASEQDKFTSLANCLAPMISTLPVPYDQAIMLVDINGQSQREAAEQIGISHSGMKSRVQRGRQKLKAALLACCEIDVNHRGEIVSYDVRAKSKCCRNPD